MNDDQVSDRIAALVHEERQLHVRSTQGQGLDDEGRVRLQTLRIELDRVGDLLSQRPTSARADLAPDAAGIRPDSGIEG
jgi:Protein of unknown function (DUF2630)